MSKFRENYGKMLKAATAEEARKAKSAAAAQSQAKAEGSSVQTQESKIEIRTPREANDDSERGLSSAEYLRLKGEIQGLWKELLELRNELRNEINSLWKATGELHELNSEILKEMHDIIYDEVTEPEPEPEPEPEQKPEPEPEELPRPMWIFRYPTKDGTIKKTLFYDQALEEALDTEMICRYVGWDTPGFPKLTDKEIDKLDIIV